MNTTILFTWVIVLAVFMLVLASMCGCSAVQEIETNASNIDKMSQSSEIRFEKIANISDVEEIDIEAEHGIIEQQSIQNSVAEIRQALPRVEDKDPSWMKLLQRFALVGILIATIFLIWQTGIGHLLRKLLYSISWFIPSKSMRDAEMDLKIADKGDDMTIREAIASKRASDPAYNSAYKKLKDK